MNRLFFSRHFNSLNQHPFSLILNVQPTLSSTLVEYRPYFYNKSFCVYIQDNIINSHLYWHDIICSTYFKSNSITTHITCSSNWSKLLLFYQKLFITHNNHVKELSSLIWLLTNNSWSKLPKHSCWIFFYSMPSIVEHVKCLKP
jgi:hypothetical protein